MHRRKFLTTATLAALAGCSGSDTEEMDEPTEDDPEESQATTADPEDTTQQTGSDDTTEAEDTTETDDEAETEAGGEASLEIVDHELVVDEGDYSTDVYVAATVENTGDAASGPVELTADWYDADENYLDNDSGYLQSLGAGETWAARIYYLGTSTEDVDSYEVDGEYDTEPKHFDPEGLALADHDMKVGEDEAVIEGEVENETGEEASYIQAIGKVYDAEGVVLGDDWTNVTDLPEGETWSFEISWRGRDRTERADGHDVLVGDSAF